MAGRGRGRGRGFSFNIEQLGIGRGELMPPPSQQPPIMFPSLISKPSSMVISNANKALLAQSREIRFATSTSPFYVKPVAMKKDIHRYSDKYQQHDPSQTLVKFMDASRLPVELKAQERKRVRPTSSKTVKPNLNKGKAGRKSTADLEKTFQQLESKEHQEELGEQEEKEEKDEDSNEEKEIEDDEFYDEEEMEEGTDYNMTYFDNGDNFLDEEEDNLDDGPVY